MAQAPNVFTTPKGIAQYPIAGGDDDDSQGALVPIKELMNYEE